MKTAITITVTINGKGLAGIPPMQYTNVTDITESALMRQLALVGEFAVGDFLTINKSTLNTEVSL